MLRPQLMTGLAQSFGAPLTLTLSPKGRGDHSAPSIFSPFVLHESETQRTFSLTPKGRGDRSAPSIFSPFILHESETQRTFSLAPKGEGAVRHRLSFPHSSFTKAKLSGPSPSPQRGEGTVRRRVLVPANSRALSTPSPRWGEGRGEGLPALNEPPGNPRTPPSRRQRTAL